jgi:hypothetical protein
MKTYGGVNVEIHIFLTSALVGAEWSASRPDRFYYFTSLISRIVLFICDLVKVVLFKIIIIFIMIIIICIIYKCLYFTFHFYLC